MKIFLASLSVELLTEFNKRIPGYKHNVLLPYSGIYYNNMKPHPYTKNNRHLINELILDSGAYTLHKMFPDPFARKREAEKLMQAYLVYCKQAHDQYDFIFSMDDEFHMDSFEHNLGRLYEFEQAGIKAVPVVHNIFDGSELKHLIHEGYDRVAIGQCKGRDNLGNLSKAVNTFNTTGVKVHLFGMTTPKLIRHVKADTCDSKSWQKYAEMGQALFWNHDRKGMDKTDIIYFPKYQEKPSEVKGHYYHDYDHLEKFKDHLEKNLNMSLKDLEGLKKEVHLHLVNMYYYMELEKVVTEHPIYV
jgi:hypothetical protein